MTADLAIVLALLLTSVVMFVVGKPRMDAVALIMIAVLPFTGSVTVPEALAGFSDANVILIAALFVIGEGLVRTGIARRLGDWLNAKAGGSETRLLVLLMVTVAGLGAFMSSTAVVAIFIPVVLRICQNTGTSPRMLMMPLSFAALISGMLTLVATAPNLVVDAELRRQGAAGFGFFSFTPFGLPILVLGIGYMLVARRLLAGGSRSADAPRRRRRTSLQVWVAQYRLQARAHRLRVTPGSPLVRQRLPDLPLWEEQVDVVLIERQRRFGTEFLRPSERTGFEPGDVLLVDVLVPGTDVETFCARHGLEPMPGRGAARYFGHLGQEVGMMEAIVPADSALIGQTVRQARLRSEHRLTVIGLRRGSQALDGKELLEEKLRLGDTLLLFGFWSDIRELRQSEAPDLVLLNLPAEFDDLLPAAGRAPQALLALGVTVALMVSGVVPNAHAALIGCLLMGALRCIDLNGAYRAINWPSLVLIVGMLPFSIALQRTGGVNLAADGLLAGAGEASPHTVLAILFVITAALGLFISNTATAVLMAPVALAIAKDLGASPYPFAMIVALAASSAFMTPVSSPVNTLVVVPGNYRFADFLRIGVPFTLVVMVASLLLVPLLLPLH